MPEMNQAHWRRDRNIRDNFGRLWLVIFDSKPDGGGSNMPTGQILAAGWSDPLATPQQYIQIPLGEFGEPDRNKIVVRYDLWITKQREAELEWKKALYQKGQQHYKSAFNPHTAEEDDFLMSVQGVGPRPWPVSEAIVRALKGDKAMLGLAPLTKADRKLLGKETVEDLGLAAEPAYAEPNPRLPDTPGAFESDEKDDVEAVRLTYPEFVKQMKMQGITEPKEVAGHWHVFKSLQG